jgi:hypothetical protein
MASNDLKCTCTFLARWAILANVVFLSKHHANIRIAAEYANIKKVILSVGNESVFSISTLKEPNINIDDRKKFFLGLTVGKNIYAQTRPALIKIVYDFMYKVYCLVLLSLA